MKLTLICVALLLSGCSTLADYGIGGPPALLCAKGQALIDDRLLGPDAARLSIVRRFADADALCQASAR